MIYRKFQDIQLSGLGLGMMRLPVLDGNDGVVDEAAAAEMIDYAYKNGINYFDTAWGYHDGNSELVAGKYLSAYPRESYYLASKFPGYDLSNMGKVEEIFERQLEKCRTLRMDFDTTRSKDSYEKILSAFANQEADILIGTQMIVKGHDFANVTLVGIVAADLSMYAADYRAAERTFQLLTQAAGRAGRGSLPGEVVIQTYSPRHYSVAAAKNQDYAAFYKEEIVNRK